MLVEPLLIATRFGRIIVVLDGLQATAIGIGEGSNATHRVGHRLHPATNVIGEGHRGTRAIGDIWRADDFDQALLSIVEVVGTIVVGIKAGAQLKLIGVTRVVVLPAPVPVSGCTVSVPHLVFQATNLFGQIAACIIRPGQYPTFAITITGQQIELIPLPGLIGGVRMGRFLNPAIGVVDIADFPTSDVLGGLGIALVPIDKVVAGVVFVGQTSIHW